MAAATAPPPDSWVEELRLASNEAKNHQPPQALIARAAGGVQLRQWSKCRKAAVKGLAMTALAVEVETTRQLQIIVASFMMSSLRFSTFPDWDKMSPALCASDKDANPVLPEAPSVPVVDFPPAHDCRLEQQHRT